MAGDRLDPGKPYRRLAMDGPAPIVVREDLQRALPNRTAKRTALAAFGHITDTHIMDPTSPAHITSTFFRGTTAFSEKETHYFRPQDSLTVQVMDAMIRRLNAVSQGPATGRTFDCYISTGDASDNRGTNEVHAFIDVMNGRKSSAFAFPGTYEGLQSSKLLPANLAKFIWQPVPPKGDSASRVWTDGYGFPTSAQVLADASRPVAAEGANVPWYSGFGNHDELAHGGTNPLGACVSSRFG
ncbi:hypothetical protein [Specibacter cremeus]|uniref:hypothetical protein n=1 Tax=Specibacter cremeus TaxID=1629051 RepID=UPI000F791EF0|nr:hypothetical protein [Specibacter cremeus]